MRQDEARERILDVHIFFGALAATRFWEELHKISEGIGALDPVSANRDTQRIIKALGVGAVLVGIIFEPANAPFFL